MGTDHLRASIYARVSSEQQARDNTIASQLEALKQRVEHDGLGLDPRASAHFYDDLVSCAGLRLPSRPGIPSSVS